MRKGIFIFIIAILAICIFYPNPERPVKKKEAKTEEADSIGEKIKATLAMYLKDSIDSAYYEGAIVYASELEWSGHEISRDSMRATYEKNIQRVDSFVRAAIQLIDSGKLKEVWENFHDEDLLCFYLHPMNVIDNELLLHQALMYMNDLFLDEQEALKRNITLWGYSDLHCSILEEMNKDAYSKYAHLFVLENLAKAYKDAADSANAVKTAERFKEIIDVVSSQAL